MALNFDWDNLKNEFQKGMVNKRKTDDRFWKLDIPEEGKTSQALIRFLPDKNGNLIVKYLYHGFFTTVDGEKKFFYEICPRTLKLNEDVDITCPICKQVGKYWNSAFESDRAIAQLRKAKLRCVSNIVVLKDPAHPENEGKVFLFQYGRKIYDKLKDVWMPGDEVEIDPDDIIIPFDPFDKGADFLLKTKIVSGFLNYDLSSFKSKKPLFNGNEKKIEEVINQTYDLSEYYQYEIKDRIKTDEELIQKMKDYGILNVEVSKPKVEEDVPDEDIVDETPAEDIDDIDFDDDDL